LAASPDRNLKFIYYDLPPIVRWFKREGQPTQFYYYLWQLFAARPARRLAATVDFDIAHHVTFAKYWAPSLLAFLKLPYCCGPVGGGESAPAIPPCRRIIRIEARPGRKVMHMWDDTELYIDTARGKDWVRTSGLMFTLRRVESAGVGSAPAREQ